MNMIHRSFLILLAVCCTPCAQAREQLDLDGSWEFRLDPQRVGVTERWFEASVPFPDRIRVPGNWQAQGFGSPLRIVRHDYQGQAWYRRTFAVPAAWGGKRVWLRFEGVCNWGEAYVNGRQIGRIETFISPYEFDVTDTVQAGRENVLAVLVDSGSTDEVQRSKISPLDHQSARGYVGMMQFLAKWGGITSHVTLEARPDLACDDLAVRSNLAAREVQVSFRLRRQQAGPAWEGVAAVRVTPVSGGAAHEAQTAVQMAATAEQSEPTTVNVSVPDLHPWSPEDPFLYQVELSVRDAAGERDRQTLRTGFRELVVRDGNFVLNGRPYFLRGVGYDSLEAVTGTPVPDKQVYVERLSHLKDLGFNFVRFLAHTPVREFFEAADEVGLFLQTEGEFFVGGLPMKPEVAALLKAQVPRLIREHRHHPCWYAFSCFNESWDADRDPIKRDYVESAYQAFRALDPDRFFIASDGAQDKWPTDVITDRSAMHRADSEEAATRVPPQVFQGSLDEVAIFDRALSEEAMRSLADSPAETSAYGDRALSHRPRAYWRMDGPQAGLLQDASGNGNHGQLHPSASSAAVTASGRHGGAVRCGSSPDSIPGLDLGDQAARILGQEVRALTVSLWVRPERFAKDDYGTFLSCGAAENGRALLLGLNGETGDGRLLVGRYFDNILASDRKLNLNEWNHVGLTYDGRRIRLFINGQPDVAVDAVLNLPPRDLVLGALVRRSLRSAAEYQSRPHVWHEFDNTYIAPLPDLDKEQRLTGADAGTEEARLLRRSRASGSDTPAAITQEPILAPHRARLESYGLLPRYQELRRLSIERYRQYVKQAYERARCLPRLDGSSWWVVADIPAGSETDVTDYGVLNMFYQPEKFPDAAWFRQFNGDSVLLIDADTDQRVLAAGETKTVQVSLSNYGAAPIEAGRLAWQVTRDGQTLQSGTLENVIAAVGGVFPLGTLKLGPFDPAGPAQLDVQVELHSAACRTRNAWTFWVFPRKKRDLPSARIVNLTGEQRLDKRYEATAERSLEGVSLVLANRVTAGLLDYVRNGGTAILLDEDAERAAVTRPGVWHESQRPAPRSQVLRRPGFLPHWPYWLRCDVQVVEQHPALGDFPHAGTSGFQFMRLYGNGVASIELTADRGAARQKVQPLVWGLSLAPWSADPTPYGLALTWHTVIGEARLERGRLLICTLYVLDGIRAERPEAGYLLDCLVQHTLSPNSATVLPPLALDEARQILKIDE